MRIHALLAGLVATASAAGVMSACVATAAPTLPQAMPSSPQAAPTLPQAPPASTATPDFDGDGKVDYALVHSVGDDFPEVVVRYGAGGELTLSTQATIGAASGFVDNPLARDLNADGYTDLAFTARQSADGIDGDQFLGVVFGSASGLDLTALHTVAVPAVDAIHDAASLALVTGPVPRLAVGSTTTLESGKSGAVILYSLSPAGLPVGDATVLRPGSGKLPKLTDRGSFGTTLASSGSQLFVGAPYAKVGSVSYAGAVTEIVVGSSGVTSAKLITQSTKGVSGAAGKLDRFGTSLAARDGYLAVGAPGDTVGGVARTGSVQLFTVGSSSVKPVKQLWQGSTGVPGKAERYDYFGMSVELGRVCADVPAVIVGGPGEVITKGHEDDGSVWVIPVKITRACPARQLWEGHGIGGQATYFRRLGSSVAVVRQAGEASDRVLMAGGGSYSEGPNGVLAIWSSQTLTALSYENDLVYGFGGR
jgi:hypothetical protein